MSITPETDTAVVNRENFAGMSGITKEAVNADFARRLEHERDGYKGAYDGAAEACRVFKNRLDAMASQMAFWREAALDLRAALREALPHVGTFSFCNENEKNAAFARWNAAIDSIKEIPTSSVQPKL